MMILALVSTGIFSVLLTARTNQVNSDFRQQAVIFTANLDGQLQQLTGDTQNGLNNICQNYCGQSCGTSNCYARLPGDPNGVSSYGTCGSGSSIHAFTPSCLHNADNLLPGWFLAAPFNGHMCYWVYGDALGSWTLNQVTSKVVWNGEICTIP